MKKISHFMFAGLVITAMASGAHADDLAAASALSEARVNHSLQQGVAAHRLMELDESAMESVAAGGQFAATSGAAAAEQGRAFSLSKARAFSNGHVTITMARTISVANGVMPFASSTAAAGTF